jgi:predicted RNA-binding protein with PIN domain
VSVGKPAGREPGPQVAEGEIAEDEAAEDGGGSPLPELADALMAPLLDAGGEVLRRLPPADLPPAARRLRSFDRRGLVTPAARHQLRRLLEDDEELLAAAAAVLLGRPEAARLVEAWQEACATGGGALLALVTEISGDGRLPLLASVLAAGLPTSFEFGLGLVVAMAATADREATAAQAVRAAGTAQAAAEEARRRADVARSAAEAAAARLETALREERQARRDVEQQVANAAAGADARRADLEAALSSAEQRAASAEQRTASAEQRAAAAEQRAAEARKQLASAEQGAAAAERRALSAEQDAAEAERRALPAEPAPAAGDGLDQGALDDVARAAEDLAVALRRLASGPVPGPERPSRPSPAPGSSPAGTRPAGAPTGRPAPRPPLSAGGPDAGRSARRAAAGPRRAAVRIPPGMQQDDPAAVAAMVRTPGLAVIVDGYNVSMLAWPDTTAADQRDRLCDALAEFQLRVRCEVTVVFDGADVAGVRPLRRRGIRIVFSAPGQEADEVVVDEVVFRPADVPVIVVSSDREVGAAAQAEGATVLPASTFLQLIRR